MASSNPSSVVDLIRHYFPAATLGQHTTEIDIDGLHVTRTLYPGFSYADGDGAKITEELTRSNDLSKAGTADLRRKEQLNVLNSYLADRTTLLGSKPSVADAILYARLSPIVKQWSQQERTGEHGYHHIVRYFDFVQNSSLIGLSLHDSEKVVIDPSEVLFVPKPLDAKQEKERKKKEKASQVGTTAEKTLVTGQVKAHQQYTAGNPEDKHQGKEETNTKGLVSGTDNLINKKEKKEKAPKPQKQPPKESPLSPSQIDLRVGHILKAEVHPNADSLFVSTIAVGDAPGTDNTSEYEGKVVRTVCSGLNGLIPLEEMQNRKIVAVCNLKPVTMRGIKSSAMVLAASPRLAEGEVDNHGGPIELVSPPTDATAGERVSFDNWDGEPEPVLNPKKKIWDMCQVGFTTTNNLEVTFEKSRVERLKGDAGEGKPDFATLRVRSGQACIVKSLKGAVVR